MQYTATGPKGEKIAWNGSAWVDASTPSRPAAQTGALPGFTPKPKVQQFGNQLGIVDGQGNFTATATQPEKPLEPKNPVFVPKDASRMFDPNTNTFTDVPKAPLEPEDQVQVRREAMDKIKLAADLIKRSKSTWFGTGIGAATMASLGSATPAGGIAADTETLASAGALARIMEMSEKAGKNLLTPISNADFQALSKSVANLDPTQPDEQYQRNVKTVLDIYKRAFVNAGGDPAEVDALLKPPAGSLDFPTFRKELVGIVSDTRVPPEQRFARAMELGERERRPLNPEEVRAAIRSGTGRAIEVEPEKPGMLEQFGQNALQAGAGLVEGAGALVDIPARAAGAVLGLGADALGFDEAAENFRNPYTVQRGVEAVVAPSDDLAGKVNRFGGQVMGGAAAFPKRAADAVVARVLGGRPPAPIAPMPPPSNRDVLKDARDLNIDLMPASVAGPTTNVLTSLVKQTPGGAQPIVSAARRMATQGQNALAGLGGRNAVHPELMGDDATRGALSYRATSRNAANDVYAAAHEASGGIKIVPQRALAELEANIAEFSNIPMGKDGAKYLTDLRDELVNNFPDGVTVAGLRGMKTQLRDRFFRDGLRGSDIERRVNDIVARTSEDLALELAQAGKGKAADLFRQADAMWTERARLLDDVIMPIIGKKGEKSGEQVAGALEAATKGNGARFQRFISALPEDEAATVRGTLVQGLGKAKSGAQNAEGDVFSFDTLLTNWNNVGPTARKALFSANDRIGMDKLARVAERAKESTKFTNYSNTGLSIMGGGTAYAGYSNPIAGIGLLIGQYATGRLLASPNVATILSKVVSAKSPAEATSRIRQLSVIAARNPAVANDVIQLQERLLGALSQSPATRAAADQE